jgi:RNA polymerase sigma-70 factor (ECF subfamily)
MESIKEKNISGASTPLGLEQYRERIRRYLLKRVGNPSEAEDLTQETFLRAHARIATLRHQKAAVSWLHRIAERVFQDYLRSPFQRRMRPMDEKTFGEESAAFHPQADPPSGVHEVLERTEMSTCVRDYLQEIPALYREVLHLHDQLGLSSPEIAKRLGCTVGAVKIRLHRARRMMKSRLSSGCEFSLDRRGIFVCDQKPA